MPVPAATVPTPRRRDGPGEAATRPLRPRDPADGRHRYTTPPPAGPRWQEPITVPQQAPAPVPGTRAGGGTPAPWKAGDARRTGPRATAGSRPGARAYRLVTAAGSLTTLAAMVVLATAVAGLADGVEPTGPATAEVSSPPRH